MPSGFRYRLIRRHGLHALCGWLVVLALAMGFPARAQDHRVIAYVSDERELPPVPAQKFDVVNFAFAVVDGGGSVVLQGPTAARLLGALAGMRRLNPALKVLVSIGGRGAGRFSEAALGESSRARFADSAVALLQAHDLDGLDIDWEYPTLPGPGISHRPEDRRNFTLLLETLRARLDRLQAATPGRQYPLTIAAAEGPMAAGIEIAQVARPLDWINLMAYDFHGSQSPTTGHHASLYRSRSAPPGTRTAEAAVDEFLAAGVPPRKLNLGVAFYGRGFAAVAPSARDGLYQRFGGDGGFLPWRELVGGYIGKSGFVRLWDAATQAPTLWNRQRRFLISYDDPQSLHAKAAFVRRRGLGGIMYWQQSNDLDDTLLDALREGLRAP